MTERKIRVQIADDHDVVVQGLLSILGEAPDLEVVGVPIRSGKQLVEQVQRTRPAPDVLLLDAKMPEFDLLVALDQLSTQCPHVKVVVVTALQDPQLARAAAKRHAAGYVLKEEALSALLPMAIREVYAGRPWFSPKTSQFLIEQAYSAKRDLSEYNLEVLRLMVQGKSPQEIGEALGRSVATIYNIQHQIRDKLGVDSNEQAMVVALKEGLVSLRLE